MAESHETRRRIVTLTVLVIVVLGAFIILRPRLWVKNKTAKVIIDGRLSEDVKLFHGSDDRLLFFLTGKASKAPLDEGPYVYDQRGLLLCDGTYLHLKIIAVTIYPDRACGGAVKAEIQEVQLNPQSLQFTQGDMVFGKRHVVVSWQAAPR